MDQFSDIEFPNSINDPFTKTSEETETYNCIAHAIGEDSVWYEPEDPVKYGSFWPDNIPKEYTEKAYIQLFVSLGFVPCDNGDLEDGFIKIAFLRSSEIEDSWWSFHATRQLGNGCWTSKLGEGVDTSHTLNCISNGKYGDVVKFFKKPK